MSSVPSMVLVTVVIGDVCCGVFVCVLVLRDYTESTDLIHTLTALRRDWRSIKKKFLSSYHDHRANAS